MKLDIIIPCAGRSSRFYPLKPKFLLTNPNGNLMFVDCIYGLDLTHINNIYVTLLKEHLKEYCEDDINFLKKATYKIKNNIIFTVLEHQTKSQCETVIETIKRNGIKNKFIVKDSDNFFKFDLNTLPENGVCFLDIRDKNISNIPAKSFVILDEHKKILEIKEKQVISDKICVGGYLFENPIDYVKNYYVLKKKITNREIFTSDIIFLMITYGDTFYGIETSSYKDWGTKEDWEKYKSTYKTMFIDLDGTLFKNCGEFTTPSWGFNEPLIENVNYLKEICATQNIQLIITTARTSKYRDETIAQLNRYNIQYKDIIFDLFHCKRFLINDFAATNSFPSAIAVNLKRNDKNLDTLI